MKARLCARCGWPMLPGRVLRRRPELRPKYRNCGGRGLCHTCWRIAERKGTLADYERQHRPRDEVLDEWVFLRSNGVGVVEAARRMGMKVSALDRALHRALNDGDERARHSCVGVWAAKLRERELAAA